MPRERKFRALPRRRRRSSDPRPPDRLLAPERGRRPRCCCYPDRVRKRRRRQVIDGAQHRALVGPAHLKCRRSRTGRRARAERHTKGIWRRPVNGRPWVSVQNDGFPFAGPSWDASEAAAPATTSGRRSSPRCWSCHLIASRSTRAYDATRRPARQDRPLPRVGRRLRGAARAVQGALRRPSGGSLKPRSFARC